MKKLFKKFVTFALVVCMAVTSCAFTFFACKKAPNDSGNVPPKDDGVSIVRTFVNENNDLIIELSDGTFINCGKVDGWVGSETPSDPDTPGTGTEELKKDESGNPLTGVANDDGKYYKDGKLFSGIVKYEAMLFDVYNGVMDLFNGFYEDKYYVSGAPFNGVDDNTLYVDGVELTGKYDDDGKYYENGKLITGKRVVDGELYDIVSGVMNLYSGVYDGREYDAGQKINGVRLGDDDKLYEYTDGVKVVYSGLYSGVEYQAGVKFTGVKDNKYYEEGLLYPAGVKVVDGTAYDITNGDMELYTGIVEDKYYDNGDLYTGQVVYQNKAYDVYGGYMELYTGTVEGKYYVIGDLANGVQADGKAYEQGLLLTGDYQGKKYENGELYTGTDPVSSLFYKDGVKYTGEYDGKYYTQGEEVELKLDGTNQPANGLFDGKVYENGLLYTGVYEGMYYSKGELLVSGTEFVDGVLYSITNGVMTGFDGEYDGKLYASGVGYTGIKEVEGTVYEYRNGTGTVYTGTFEGKLYEDGKLFSGRYTDNKVYLNGVLLTGFGDDGKLYSNGMLHSGKHTDGKLYANGELFTGENVSDKKYYENGELFTGTIEGKLYDEGVLFNGTHTDGLFYKNGEILTGKDTATNTVYENGLVFSGEYSDGKVYQNGKLLTGIYNGKYYQRGTLLEGGYVTYEGTFYSVVKGVMSEYTGVYSQKYYEDGKLYTGLKVVSGRAFDITDGVMVAYSGELEGKIYKNGNALTGLHTDGLMYSNGVILTGQHTDGKLYVNGLLFSGTYSVDEKLYKDGLLFTGEHTDSLYYKDGVILTGSDNGKLYVDGLLFTGVYTDNKLYDNGALFSGLNDSINVNGAPDNKVYKNGSLLTGEYDGKLYINGEIYEGEDGSTGVTIESIQAKYDALGVVYTDVSTPTTITMAHHDNEGANQERSILDILIKAFNNRYPNIKVQLDIIGEYEDTYTARVNAGTMHDVFAVPDGKYYQWQSLGRLRDLSAQMRNSSLVDTSDMYSSVLTRFQTNGSQYVMPRDISVHVMYYNKDMFDARGVAYPPSDRIMTIDEATTMWKNMTYTSASGQIYGNAGLGMEGLVWSAGGDFLNASRTAFPTDTTTVNGIKRAYQYIQDAYFVHQCLPHSSDLGSMDASAYFGLQKVATLIDGSWNMATFRDYNFNWDIAYVPAFEVNPTKNAWSGSVGYAIGTNSTKSASAWKLVEYIGSKEGQEILAATGFQFPLYTSLGEDESYIANQAMQKPNNYHVFIQSAKNQPAGTWTYTGSTAWKTLGYDQYSQNLLDSNPNNRWDINRYISQVQSAVNSRL